MTQQVQYVYDPVKWAYEMLRFEPDQWQKEEFDAFIKKRFLCWSTGTGVGKSASLAVLGLFFLSTRPFAKVPCTAPSQHQLYDVLWAEYASWLRRNELLRKMFKWTQTRIGLRGHEEEWYAVARTSRPKPGDQHAEGLQGFHAENLLFEIDEASAVDDSIFSAVDGAFTTEGTYCIIASNPTRRRGYHYRQISDPESSSYHVKFVDARTCKMVTPDSIQRVVAKYGEDSDFYRVKILGLPPKADSASLITDEQIIAAHHCEVFPAETDLVVVSCDPARFGDDYTVMYARKGSKILKREQYKSMDTMAVADFCIDLITSFDADRILIDTIGIGSGVADRVRQISKKHHLKVQVIDVNVSERAIEEDRFINKRAEMFWHLRTRINGISIPFDTPLLDEELPLIDYSAEKKIILAAKESIKEEIRRATGVPRSPNDADALALLFYNEVLRKEFSCSSRPFKLGTRSQSSLIKGENGATSIIQDAANVVEMQQFLSSTGGRSTLRSQVGVVGGNRYSRFRGASARASFGGFNR